ncbi:MAG TPA: beta-ketoacyl-[acyl-carrier-protein] synthase family protein, partial [Planctomycetota bacterium]|nr:beta-ketoacyl-[acyl-carrier-protein] synthase family protein [Planctomycetota bacterium]
ITIEEGHARLLQTGPRKISPFTVPRLMVNACAGNVSIKFDLKGANTATATACATGGHSIGSAFYLIQRGSADVMFAGGSEAAISHLCIGSFAAMKALSTRNDAPEKASRPFDRDRNGIVASEGGALYVLERRDDALARGARIVAELVGWHVNSDGTDFVLPDSAGQEACMRGALRHAELAPEAIDVINTHATSTPSGDEIECRAVRAVFGDSPDVRVNNTKSFIGHAMGAAGALELAGNLPSFTDGLVHPTINVENLDPECELSGLVLDTPARPARIDHVLNMSFGMLGINSAVVVARP